MELPPPADMPLRLMPWRAPAARYGVDGGDMRREAARARYSARAATPALSEARLLPRTMSAARMRHAICAAL